MPELTSALSDDYRRGAADAAGRIHTRLSIYTDSIPEGEIDGTTVIFGLTGFLNWIASGCPNDA